ncbi:site-specific integrase [Paraburkholderia sp. HD33-4]|uniref:site-specific integrase n=1 Tax=Paraburkholderia sp. HD33-4 TaxID=2883242 RepID=UPI001F25BDFC|nr:site-specific integrase [Paraburkholderia sp. HD33-4]
MVTRSHRTLQPERAPTTQDILRVWRADRCVRASSAQQYLQWISRFRRYCDLLGLDEAGELTRDGVKRFQAWYAHLRGIPISHLDLASSSMRSLHRVYEFVGAPVPPWRPIERRPQPVTAVLRDFATHLRQHRGNPEVTIRKKLDHVGKLLEHLSRSGKSWRQLSLPDIDAFLIGCARRYARSTTADIASTVRSFARFLLFSGRTRADLADAVISPVQPRFERPRRALPWEDVQRLLRAVDTSTARGLRDHALLLMMSTYGLGAGEVIGLQLQHIDWNAGTLQMSRPKTGVNFVLPLLPPVAKVLARYLRHGRPSHTPTRHVFVRMKVPFGAFTASSAVRHILIKHAAIAGIQAPYLGSHVLRHSNAARQLDIGTTARVLSDLLGHRDPESVSAYVRIATQSLREVSLPVPR